MISPQSASSSTVASSTALTTLFAQANGYTNARTLYNASTAVLYLSCGTAASTTAYTLQVPSGGYFEFPVPVYGGAVTGVWAAANGYAAVTSW